MSEPTQQQRIDRLAEWAHLDQHGWSRGRDGIWRSPIPDDLPHRPYCRTRFDPFTSLDHAHLLLLECERRELLREVSYKLMDLKCCEAVELVGLVVLATAKQQTEAVEAVAGLGEK